MLNFNQRLMTPGSTLRSALLASSALLFASGIAQAQDVPATAAAPTAPAASPDVDAQPADITVTARRRKETLQTTPIAITAITTVQLENKASVNIGDLQGAAPNLLITQQTAGGAAANLSIRGLAFADIEKSREPTVAVVVDGVFIGTNTGQFLDFFDIQQIEVLRGPQGTLFGRNTIGGVINIQRTRPTGRFGGKFEASYGSFNSKAGRAVVNVPVISDVLAAKVFYFHTDTDGYYRDGATGRARGGGSNKNFGGSLLFTPSTDFNALLTLEKQVVNFEPVNSNISRPDELFCQIQPAYDCTRNITTDLYTVGGSPPAYAKYSAPAATLEMNANLGRVTLTSITSIRKSKEDQTNDFDGSDLDLFYVRRVQKYRQISQELRAAGKLSDKFDYVVGGYYFSSKFFTHQFTSFLGANNPVSLDPNSGFVSGKTRSLAAFGDFNWQVIDRVRLSFGGRYTSDKKSLFKSFATDGVIGTGEATFKKFTPKIGLDYRPNDNMMFYASWSRGYRSGGFSSRAATEGTIKFPFLPETVDSYEIGTKLSMLDRKLLVNLAAFSAKYKGLQQDTTIPGGPTGEQSVTSNVGSADIKGIEVEVTARPAHGLTLRAAAGLLDSKFKDFVVGVVRGGTIVQQDYSANNLIYAPKATLSASAEYSVPVSDRMRLTAIAGIRHISPYDQQISLGPLSGNLVTGPIIVNGNDPRVRTNTQNLVDASLTAAFNLSGKKFKVSVYGRNLTDDRGASAAFTVAGLWSFAAAREPRAFGASVGFEF